MLNDLYTKAANLLVNHLLHRDVRLDLIVGKAVTYTNNGM